MEKYEFEEKFQTVNMTIKTLQEQYDCLLEETGQNDYQELTKDLGGSIQINGLNVDKSALNGAARINKNSQNISLSVNKLAQSGSGSVNKITQNSAVNNTTSNR